MKGFGGESAIIGADLTDFASLGQDARFGFYNMYQNLNIILPMSLTCGGKGPDVPYYVMSFARIVFLNIHSKLGVMLGERRTL